MLSNFYKSSKCLLSVSVFVSLWASHKLVITVWVALTQIIEAFIWFISFQSFSLFFNIVQCFLIPGNHEFVLYLGSTSKSAGFWRLGVMFDYFSNPHLIRYLLSHSLETNRRQVSVSPGLWKIPHAFLSGDRNMGLNVFPAALSEILIPPRS